MAERQIHGFNYQNHIITKYHLTATHNYTDEWDAFYRNIPVSIKTKKRGGNIELGDIYRQAHINKDFLIFIGFWDGDESNIVEEYILYIPATEWHTHFDNDCLDKYQELIHTISNDRSDDAKWTKAITELRKEWKNTTDYLIVPRPKRDHKTQKRIQCAINTTSFYKHFLPKYRKDDFFERNN